jgi:hypothetical protein
VLVSRFTLDGTAIYCCIRGEEIQRVQTKDSEFVRNNFNVEPAAALELMALGLRYELAPDIKVFLRPGIGPFFEDVVREDIVVAEGGNDGNDEIVGRIVIVVVLGLSKD